MDRLQRLHFLDVSGILRGLISGMNKWFVKTCPPQGFMRQYKAEAQAAVDQRSANLGRDHSAKKAAQEREREKNSFRAGFEALRALSKTHKDQ